MEKLGRFSPVRRRVRLGDNKAKGVLEGASPVVGDDERPHPPRYCGIGREARREGAKSLLIPSALRAKPPQEGLVPSPNGGAHLAVRRCQNHLALPAGGKRRTPDEAAERDVQTPSPPRGTTEKPALRPGRRRMAEAEPSKRTAETVLSSRSRADWGKLPSSTTNPGLFSGYSAAASSSEGVPSASTRPVAETALGDVAPPGVGPVPLDLVEVYGVLAVGQHPRVGSPQKHEQVLPREADLG